MAKNTISTPIKDGVLADNVTWSSNKIKSLMESIPEIAAAELIDDDIVSDSKTWSSEKINSLIAPVEAGDSNE